MLNWDHLIGMIDWFIPSAAKAERSELSLARNFVFTHLFGPALSQSISLFLYLSDPHPGVACWTVIICIWLFWTLPFVYRWSGSLQLSALISVELLAFTSLFGSYYYGGVSSPFLPWLIISLLLGFFYLSERPILVVGLFTFNILGFCLAYLAWGFPELVPQEAAFDGRLDLHPVRNDLHVVDGDLLRQHDRHAVRPRTRSGAPSRNRNPPARGQGYGRCRQPGRSRFSWPR